MNGHVFMLGHKHDNGTWERYDFGSQARIDKPMPSVEAVTGVVAVVRPTYKAATVDKRALVRKGQQAINNILVGERIVWTIAEDGVYGSQTKTALRMVLQICLNRDYGQRLKVDGDIREKSKAAILGHYIKRDETQWLVTYAEIAAYLNGKNPNGIEMPGHYGSGLEKALGKSYLSWTELLAFVR
jgi:surface antigen